MFDVFKTKHIYFLFFLNPPRFTADISQRFNYTFLTGRLVAFNDVILSVISVSNLINVVTIDSRDRTGGGRAVCVRPHIFSTDTSDLAYSPQN